MALQDYVPDNDGDFCALLAHVSQTLPQYYSTLGISSLTPQVAALIIDATTFTYLCTRQTTLSQAGQGSTRERNRIRFGDPDNPAVLSNLAYPSAPGSPPTPILPGLEKRFRDFVNWLRELPAYEDAIGLALQLVGPQATPPDAAALKPVLPLSLSGNQVQIAWKWQSARSLARALRIEVDRGQGWELLTIDTQPGYTDKTALPATPQKWKYRAIFIRDDEPIGQWSDVAEITVGA